MTIITLNTWGGRGLRDKLLAFFEAHRHTTDIFCLQEIWGASYEHLQGKMVGGRVFDVSSVMSRGLQDISELLSDFMPYFRPHHGDQYGLLMLVKKTHTVKEEGERFVYKERGYVSEEETGNHARNIQYVELETEHGKMTVINFHGLWNGQGKTDTPDRLLQSQKIVQFLKTRNGHIIFCGDFNLLPTTESIHLIEQTGLRNLIKEYGVTSTRTSFYTKPDKFADYVFVSPGLTVKSFEVMQEEVSDHCALRVEVGK
jgi:endonuclease/exonuclease/phosphatase family metal-dependent hydrolase